MLRLLADENLNRTIVTGVRKRVPDIEFPRVQDLHLDGTLDSDLLRWAAEENRIVVSHDVTTMTKHATDRVREGLLFPGLLLVPSTTSAAVAMEELVILCECSEQGEWQNRIAFLPL